MGIVSSDYWRPSHGIGRKSLGNEVRVAKPAVGGKVTPLIASWSRPIANSPIARSSEPDTDRGGRSAAVYDGASSVSWKVLAGAGSSSWAALPPVRASPAAASESASDVVSEARAEAPPQTMGLKETKVRVPESAVVTAVSSVMDIERRWGMASSVFWEAESDIVRWNG